MCQIPVYPRPVYPRPLPYPSPGGLPWQGGDRQHHWNLPNSQVDSGRGGWWPFSQSPTQGYGIDLNNNGRYDRGRDGVLVFDHNRDGKYDKRDVSATNDMMRAATGNYDFNNDGRVSLGERISGMMHRHRYQQLDRNRDGRLDTAEIQAGGGRVWVDHSRGGGISNNELYSPYNIPGGFCQRGGRRLNSVDPFWGSNTSSNSPWWNRPFCGGIRPTPYQYR